MVLLNQGAGGCCPLKSGGGIMALLNQEGGALAYGPLENLDFFLALYTQDGGLSYGPPKGFILRPTLYKQI